MDAGDLEDGGLKSQSPSPLLSGGRGFCKEGGGTEQRDQGMGVAQLAQCIPIRQVIVRCASLWSSHPGFMSS